MKRTLILTTILLTAVSIVSAQNVSIEARGRNASSVFKELMKQTGKNFIYTSDLLKGMKVTIDAKNEPLAKVLDKMFSNTGVTYTIVGNNVTLKRANATKTPQNIALSGRVTEAATSEPIVGALVAIDGSTSGVFTNNAGLYSLRVPKGVCLIKVSYPGFLPQSVRINTAHETHADVKLYADSTAGTNLKEVVVTADINNSIAMRSSEVGRINLNISDIKSTPAILGESDVVKTLQMQPGVSPGMEGLAGMYVHGGAADENLVLLDGVPLYQANHFGGLFSTFNVDVIKNVDFYKSSFPAAYGGRLSSVLDVHTKDGSTAGHHGSLRIGLTSGAFNIDGPISKNTTYSLALRRSWYEVLSAPALALYNHFRQDNYNKTVARYAFMDINAKVTHSFKNGGRLHAMFYYGDDYLKGGEKENERSNDENSETSVTSSDIARLHWGNIVGSIGYNHPFSSTLFGEFSLSTTHFMSSIKRDSKVEEKSKETSEIVYGNSREWKSSNNITDLIARAAFSWNPLQGHKVDFGAEFTHHIFKPQEEGTAIYNGRDHYSFKLQKENITAEEGALYISDDWDITDPVRINAGLRGGFYYADGAKHFTLDPRASVRWAINDSWSVKGSYALMTQYVHQLNESFLALPTDRWVPIAGNLKPQRSHNLSAGVYFTFGDGYTVSAEGYWRWLKNVIDYTDFYYLLPQSTPWHELLTSGEGRARGLDFSLSKSFGKISGHIAYSLLWADRRYDNRNGGKWTPDRFDNRHKINIMVNWKINSRWSVNAAWTGMSGNRYTLQTQNYLVLPDTDIPFIDSEWSGSIDIAKEVNNRRLPFYHRLDLSASLTTKRGEWTFSLYNVYCNMNPVSVRKQFWYNAPAKFQYFRLLPTIPGVSYTWYF